MRVRRVLRVGNTERAAKPAGSGATVCSLVFTNTNYLKIPYVKSRLKVAVPPLLIFIDLAGTGKNCQIKISSRDLEDIFHAEAIRRYVVRGLCYFWSDLSLPVIGH